MWIRVCFVRRRVSVLFKAVSVTAACCALVAGGGAASAGAAASSAPAVAGATGTWGDAAAVSGFPNWRILGAYVTAVSCAGVGDCSAVGTYGDYSGQTTPFAVDETGGIWGKAHVILGTGGYEGGSTVNSVSCASPGNCSAGGSLAIYQGADAPNKSQAFVVNEKDGVWGAAKIVPGSSALNVGDTA